MEPQVNNPESEVAVEGNWKICDIDEVKMGSGEELEEILFECTVKLYRFDDKQWKDRAVGQFKFLKHKETTKVRGILRQTSTDKIMANFFLWGEGLVEITPHPTNKNSWMWSCIDFSDIDLDQRLTSFTARFKTVEDCTKFKEVFDLAVEENNKLEWKTTPVEATKPKITEAEATEDAEGDEGENDQ